MYIKFKLCTASLSLSFSLSEDATNKVISSEMWNIGTFSRPTSALPPLTHSFSRSGDMEMMFLRLIDNWSFIFLLYLRYPSAITLWWWWSYDPFVCVQTLINDVSCLGIDLKKTKQQKKKTVSHVVKNDEPTVERKGEKCCYNHS